MSDEIGDFSRFIAGKNEDVNPEPEVSLDMISSAISNYREDEPESLIDKIHLNPLTNFSKSGGFNFIPQQVDNTAKSTGTPHYYRSATADILGISIEDIDKLAEYGQLKGTVFKVTDLRAKGKDVAKDEIEVINGEEFVKLIEIGSLQDFSDKYRSAKEIAKRSFNTGHLTLDEITGEFNRFLAPARKNGLNPLPWPNPSKIGDTDELFYSVASVDKWFESLGRTDYRLKGGLWILDELKSRGISPGDTPLKEKQDNELNISELIGGLGLPSDQVARVITHYLHGKMSMYDAAGIIEPKVNKMLGAHDSKDREEVRKKMLEFMLISYVNHLSNDKWNALNEVIKLEPDLPYYAGIVDLRITKEGLEKFKSDTIGKREFIEEVFPGCTAFFDKRDDRKFTEIYQEQSALLGKTEEKGLFPIMVNGDERYCSCDVPFYFTTEDINHIQNLRTLVRMQTALDNYETMNLMTLSHEEVAAQLGISKERALTFPLGWENFFEKFTFQEKEGHEKLAKKIKVFIDKFDKSRKGYEVPEDPKHAEDIYVKALENGFNGFSLEQLKAVRTTNKDLGTYIATLVESDTDVNAMNDILKTQYSIRGEQGFLFREELQPIKWDGKLLYSEGAIEEVNGVIAKDAKLRRKLELFPALKNAYERADYSAYISLEEFKQSLGLSKEEWEKIKEYVNAANPAVNSLGLNGEGREEAIEFDIKYFSDKGNKEWVSKNHAKRIMENFIKDDDISKYLTGIPLGFDELKSIAEGNGISIEDMLDIDTYRVKINNDGEERYFAREIAKIRQNNNDIKKLQVLLALNQNREIAGENAGEYFTKKKAREMLGLDNYDGKKTNGFDRLIEKHLLQSGDIGLGIEIADLANKANPGLNLKPEDIYEHSSLRRTDGVNNLNAFIAETQSFEDIKQRLFGKNELADWLYDFHLGDENPLDLTFLKIGDVQKLHKSDVEKLETSLSNGAYKSHLRSLVAEKLGVGSIPKQYKELDNDSIKGEHRQSLEIPHSMNRQSIENLAARIERFKENCYSLKDQKIQSEILGFTFSDNSYLESAMKAVNPRSISFLDGKYHMSDIENLKLTIDVTYEEIGIISAQKFVEFVELGYVNLCEDGIESSSVKNLVQNSYSEAELNKISEKLITEDQVFSNVFKYNNNSYCPAEIVRGSVENSELDNISLDGIRLLLRNKEWLSKEIKVMNNNNGNCSGHPDEFYERDANRVIEYLFRSLPNGKKDKKEKTFLSSDFTKIKRYIGSLEDNKVHNLAHFSSIKGGTDINADVCYLTKKEAVNVSGLEYALNELENKCIDAGEVRLYSLSDVSQAILKNRKNLENFKNPLDVYILSAVIYEKNHYLSKLKPEFKNDGNLEKVDKNVEKELAHNLKIDFKLCKKRLPLVFEEIAYQTGSDKHGPDNARKYLIRMGAAILKNQMDQKLA